MGGPENLSDKISWVSHDEDLTWYPASDIKYALYKLRKFYIAYEDLPEPPKNLA